MKRKEWGTKVKADRRKGGGMTRGQEEGEKEERMRRRERKDGRN